MKTRQIVATVLIFIAFIIHSAGGELTDIRSLILTDLAVNIKIELRAVWYLASIDFLVSGIFMIVVIRKNIASQNKLLVDFIGLRMILYGLAFLILVIYVDYNLLFQVPQWILLIIIGVLLEWEKYFAYKAKVKRWI